MRIAAFACLLWMLATARTFSQEAQVNAATDPGQSAEHLFAEIETNKGAIEAELDFRQAPLTVMNFVGLAEGKLPFQNRPAGKPFFDGLTFHRVVKDFVVQGGDPLSADPATPAEKLGEGGPGYSFPDEFAPGLRHDAAGVLSMANDGPDTNGSQFFITLREVNRLNYLHSVFGQVVHGLDVVDRIEPGDKIVHVTIRRVGPAAEAFTADAAAFETLKNATVAKRHPAAPSGFVYLEDASGKLPDFRVKNFNFKLANYERTTGHRVAVRVVSNPGGASGHALSKALGFTDDGNNVLLMCLAAEKAGKHGWAKKLIPPCSGSPGPTEKLMANGVMHEKKTALLAAAVAQLNADKPKESVDAAIDTTILALDDYAVKQAGPARP